MKTFAQFCTEAYDADVMSRSQIRRTGEGGRIGAMRKKSEPERRRVRAVGGGKTEVVKYKERKDIGTQRSRSEREQAPTQERGSARERQLAAAKAERKKAALARLAAKKSGAKPAPEKPKAKEVEKKASELLKKKEAPKAPAPGYKAPKASGLSTKERLEVTRKGEKTLKDMILKATGKKKEKELKHRYTSR